MTTISSSVPDASLLASPVGLSTTPQVAEWIKEYDARPGRFGTDAARLNEEPEADNELCAGLRQVHPVLQVRGRLRRPVAEHVRDLGRGALLRRADRRGARIKGRFGYQHVQNRD